MRKQKGTPVKKSVSVPFPNLWLKRFAEIIPLSGVILLARTSKSIHTELTRNAIWKTKSMTLPEFDELSEYERNVNIWPEGFWFEWYMDRIPRFIPIDRSSNSIIPKQGRLFTTTTVNFGTDLMKFKVVVGVVIPPKGNKVGHFFIADSLSSISQVITSGKVAFKRHSLYRVIIRTNENFSINLFEVNVH